MGIIMLAMAGSGQVATPFSSVKFQSPHMQRREMICGALLLSLAPAPGPAFSIAQAISSDVTAAARGEDGSKSLSDPNWKASFFNDQQNETRHYSERGDNSHDTPGAQQALVNRYLDLLSWGSAGEVSTAVHPGTRVRGRREQAAVWEGFSRPGSRRPHFLAEAVGLPSASGCEMLSVNCLGRRSERCVELCS
ncbi:MAG: hypothetical protein JO356_15955 [Acidobacteria bacterium]|nr:hypothetical protein [Acidobacteriota bacterium]